jgi:hypothetical protein
MEADVLEEGLRPNKSVSLSLFEKALLDWELHNRRWMFLEMTAIIKDLIEYERTDQILEVIEFLGEDFDRRQFAARKEAIKDPGKMLRRLPNGPWKGDVKAHEEFFAKLEQKTPKEKRISYLSRELEDMRVILKEAGKIISEIPSTPETEVWLEKAKAKLFG